jgi:short subunit dehydrogenase-like uncharacterized protein
MTRQILLYGASGYTGRLLAAEAARRGIDVILAGRDPARLAPVAAAVGLPWVAAPTTRLASELGDVAVVLNAAGPFSQTAAPILEACLATGTHYLDVTGEVDVLEDLSTSHARAREHGIMVMPGVGFDVVPSDCLAASVSALMPDAIRLDVVIHGLGLASRGSVRTMLEQAGTPTRVRRAGVLTSVPLPASGPERRTFRFQGTDRTALPASWGDVVTAWYTTGIPDITTWFTERPGLRELLTTSRWLRPYWQSPYGRLAVERSIQLIPEGPSHEERARARLSVAAFAEDASGAVVAAEVETPESYTFTAMSGIEIARRVANGDFEVGFQTPARVYGADLILNFDNCLRRNLPAAGAALHLANAALPPPAN